MVAGLILVIVGCLGFALIAFIAAPKIFRKIYAAALPARDRGLNKFIARDARGVLYAPSLETREYIGKYMLYIKEGKKRFVCELAKPLSYIDYDLIIYDGGGNVIKVLRVKDNTVGKRFSSVITLPERTAYVTLSLNRADNIKFAANRLLVKRSAGYLIAFIIVSFLAMVFVDLCTIGGMAMPEFIFFDFGAYGLEVAAIATAVYAAVLLIALTSGRLISFIYKKCKRNGAKANAGKASGKLKALGTNFRFKVENGLFVRIENKFLQLKYCGVHLKVKAFKAKLRAGVNAFKTFLRPRKKSAQSEE